MLGGIIDPLVSDLDDAAVADTVEILLTGAKHVGFLIVLVARLCLRQV